MLRHLYKRESHVKLSKNAEKHTGHRSGPSSPDRTVNDMVSLPSKTWWANGLSAHQTSLFDTLGFSPNINDHNLPPTMTLVVATRHVDLSDK